jgi:hypothetical protein
MNVKHILFIIYVFNACFNITSLKAKTAIDIISDFTHETSELRLSCGPAQKITEHNKEIIDIAIGNTYGIDFTRRATDQERRTVLRGLIQNAITDREHCFEHFCDPLTTDKRYVGHLKWLFMMQFASYLIVENRAGLLWDKEMLVSQVYNSSYNDYLSKTKLSDSWRLKLRDVVDSGHTNQDYIKKHLPAFFFDELSNLTYHYPDVKDQWLAEVAFIKRLNNPRLMVKDQDRGHMIYKSMDGCFIAIEKSCTTEAKHRSSRPRLYQFELACTEIAEACGLGDVIVPVVHYKNSTFEPYISILKEPSKAPARVKSFVKTVKDVNIWDQGQAIPTKGKFEASDSNFKTNSLALSEVIRFLKKGVTS